MGAPMMLPIPEELAEREIGPKDHSSQAEGAKVASMEALVFVRPGSAEALASASEEVGENRAEALILVGPIEHWNSEPSRQQCLLIVFAPHQAHWTSGEKSIDRLRRIKMAP